MLNQTLNPKVCCDWLLLTQLLAWLCTDKESGEAQRHSIAAALAMLASAPGSRGLSLASAWLGDMLVTLSHNVKTYSSIRVVGLFHSIILKSKP